MAEMTVYPQYVLKLTAKEANIIIRGLGGLLNPNEVGIRGEEREFVRELNIKLLETMEGQLTSQLNVVNKKLAKAKAIRQLPTKDAIQSAIEDAKREGHPYDAEELAREFGISAAELTYILSEES